jgi:hypothetical protein
MIEVSLSTLIIIALVAILIGIILGVSLSRPIAR